MAQNGPLRALTVEALTDLLASKKTDVTKQKLTEIDFTSDKFRLETLENITIIGHHNPKDRDRIKEFYISDNHLTSLLPLAIDNHVKAFRRMEVLDASNNLIVNLCAGYKGNLKFNEWPYHMESLVELKLLHNRITSIPNLQTMPNLKRLDLSHNFISPPWRNLRYGKHLQHVGLSNNDIDWTKQEFNKELKVLEYLPELRTITLMENPFCATIHDYNLYLLKEIINVQKSSKYRLAKDKLEYIDGNKVTPQLRKQAEDVPPLVGTEKIEVGRVIKPVETTRAVESKKMPGIADMILLLNQAFSDPTGCIVLVHKLMDQARMIKEMRSSHPQLFSGALSEQDLKKKDKAAEDLKQRVVNEFLQQNVLLMQRQPQLVPSLLRVLANLAGVVEGKLGARCLEALQDVMSAGEGYKDTVVEVMNECVIPQLKQSNIVDDEDKLFRDTLTRGMNELATKTGIGECLSGLVDSLVGWMGQDPSDEVISMCAVASNHAKNAQSMGSEPKMLGYIIEELKPEKCSSSEKFYRLIKTATNIAKFDEVIVQNQKKFRSAHMFVKLGLQRTVLEALKELLSMKSSFNEAQNKQIAMLVACLESISLCKDGLRDLLSKKTGYLKVLIRLYQLSRQDSLHIRPLLLTAVFSSIFTILSAPEEWFPFQWGSTYRVDLDSLEKELTDGLQNVLPILAYLNQDDPSYRAMCVEAGQGAMLHSKPLKIKNLTNLEMHAFIVSCITLISHYCEAASKRALPEKVASMLNENNREKFLFDCLECPSDQVRKAVVGCLYHVPLAELDEEEVSRLVNMLSETSNISAGETEIVLGQSFSLLTKLVLSLEETGRIFRERQAELAIQAALDILERNSMRDTRGNESEDAEKFTLSHSCVRYLIGSSIWRPEDEENNMLRRHLRNRDVMESLGNILRYEDKFASLYKLIPTDPSHIAKSDYRPVYIEMSWAGRTLEYLLQTLIGDNALRPHGVVAQRIMRRMADVLMGVQDPFLEEVRAVYRAAGDTGERSSRIIDDTKNIDNNIEDDEDDDDADDDDIDDDEDLEDNANDDGDYPLDESRKKVMDPELRKYFKSIRTAFANLAEENILGLERWASKQEASMPLYWCDSSASYDPGYIEETEDERNERLQQHHVFVYYRGLQRIIFFLAQRLTDEEEKQYGLYEEAFPASEIISECSDQLLRFRAIVKKKRDKEISESTSSAKKRAEELESKGPEKKRVGKQTTVGGRKLLLHAFMMDGMRHGKDTKTSSFLNSSSKAKEYDRAGLIAAGLRSIYAILCFGDRKTRAAAMEILLDNDRIRLLANVATCSRESPIWSQNLIGAKFMAVAMESIKLDVTARSVPTSALPAYDVICRYAQAVVSMVIAKLERESKLTEEDEILMMHTALACATVAEQIPHVIKPGQGAMEKSMETKMAEYLYSRLLPRNMLKSLIKIILYDMQVSQVVPNADTDMEERERRYHIRSKMCEAIKTVIVEFLRNSEQHRFEILEQFTREEIENNVETRQSFVQDMLAEVNRRVYRAALQEYMAKENCFEFHRYLEESGNRRMEFGIVGKMTSERIVEAEWVQQFVPEKLDFEPVLLVLSNFQMYLLKEPTLVFGPCKECSADKFCPEGPVLKSRIKYYQIQRAILGMGHQRLHLQLKRTLGNENKADGEDKTSGEIFHFIVPKLGGASRLHRHILQLTEGTTAEANPRLAGIDEGVIKVSPEVPSFEVDMATKHALVSLLQRCNELQIGEGLKDGMIKLITTVDLYDDMGLHRGRRTLILTRKLLLVCKEHLEYWDFPRYWKDEMDSMNDEFAAKKKEIDMQEGSKESKLDKSLANQRAKRNWSMKQSQLRSQYIERHQKMFTIDKVQRVSGLADDSKHNLSNLNEACFSRGPLPAAFLGFEKTSTKKLRVLWQDSKNSNHKIESKSDIMYVIMFPDDSSRELWRLALGTQLAKMGRQKVQ